MLKKINLRGITESLCEKELKNVKGGSGTGWCSYDQCSSGELCGPWGDEYCYWDIYDDCVCGRLK